MKILKRYVFKIENGLPVFPRYFKSVVFEHDSGSKYKLTRKNSKYYPYSSASGSSEWQKLHYHMKLADARKTLKYYLNDDDNKFVHIEIDA